MSGVPPCSVLGIAHNKVMTAINITAITVLDNPTLFVNPFQFEIQYECIQDLQHGELSAIFAPLCTLSSARNVLYSTLSAFLPIRAQKLAVRSTEVGVKALGGADAAARRFSTRPAGLLEGV